MHWWRTLILCVCVQQRALKRLATRPFSSSTAIFDRGKWWSERARGVDSGRLLIGRLLRAAVKRQQRNNVALRANGDEYEYLKDEVARRLVDRLEVSALCVLLAG